MLNRIVMVALPVLFFPMRVGQPESGARTDKGNGNPGPARTGRRSEKAINQVNVNGEER